MAEEVEVTGSSNQSFGATTKLYRSRRKGDDSYKHEITKFLVAFVIVATFVYFSNCNVKLDEVRAREIIRQEIEKHAADGLGRVDYALASGGGSVTKHSQTASVGGVWFSKIGRNGVHVDSVKMLRPSFGEPGDCFDLSGSSGFVEIKLGKAIVPEAVTLEHVDKSVAYDRSSAPKNCRVYGWLTGQETDIAHNTEKMFSLAEFTYDLEKSNAQTFDVSHPGVVDTIRLDFTTNHGKASHTSIYRLRVHGHEPYFFVPLAIKS